MRSVVEQLERRQFLTSVSAIEFDYGASPHSIRVTFDSAINPSSLSVSDLFVRQVGSDLSRIATTSFTASVNNSNTVATFTYTATDYFSDGDYVVDLFKEDVLNASGQPLTVDASSSFFFLYTDLSGPSGSRDRIVNTSDGAYVQSKIGTANPTYGDGDVDDDGAVTIDDIYFVMDYYGEKLITPVDGLEGLTATPTNTTNVQLTWARKSTTNTGFRVQRSLDGGRTFTTIASNLSATAETYTDTTADLSASGYMYRVRSIEPNQPFTSIARLSRYFGVSIAQNATGGGSPIAPPDDVIVASVGKNSITLEWTDTSTGEAGFEFYRSDDGGVTYKSVHYLQVEDATTWTDTNLKAEKTYYYVVRTRGANTSTYSDVASGTTLAGAPTVIKANFQETTSTPLKHVLFAEFDQTILQNLASLDHSHVQVFLLSETRQLVGGSDNDYVVLGIDNDKILIGFSGDPRGDLSSVPGIFPDGNYEVIVRGDAVKNGPPANQTIADSGHPDLEGVASTFYFRGDFNRDRRIGFDDLLILAQNYGLANRTDLQGDTDYDGDADFDDLLRISQTYGQSLPEIPSSNNSLTVGVQGETTLHLTWTPPANEAFLGFHIWRTFWNGTGWTEAIVTDSDGDPIVIPKMTDTVTGLPVTSYTFDDVDRTQGMKYRYRVRPYDAGGSWSTTNLSSAVTSLPAPTNFRSGRVVQGLESDANYWSPHWRQDGIYTSSQQAAHTAAKLDQTTRLKWRAPANPENVDGYRVKVILNGNQIGQPYYVATGEQDPLGDFNATIAGLQAGLKYQIVVESYGSLFGAAGPTFQIVTALADVSIPAPTNGIPSVGRAAGAGTNSEVAGLVSEAGVRYADGAITESSADLISNSFGFGWGVTRSWTNIAGYSKSTNRFGNGWSFDQLAKLRRFSDDTIGVVAGGEQLIFDRVGTSNEFRERFVGQERITYEPTAIDGQPGYVLRDTVGNKSVFSPLGDSVQTSGLQVSFTHANGVSVAIDYAVGSDMVTEMRRIENNITERFEFGYYVGGVHDGLVQYVRLRRDDADTSTTIDGIARLISYSYYGLSDAHGNLNDLKLVVTKTSTGGIVGAEYYRYHKSDAEWESMPPGSNPGAMKMHFSKQSFARFDGETDNVFTASDATAALYADRQFKYVSTSDRRVSEVLVKGRGATAGTSATMGQGRYTYAYSRVDSNTSRIWVPDTAKEWKWETTERQMDQTAATNIDWIWESKVLSNAFGQVMGKRFTREDADVRSGQGWSVKERAEEYFFYNPNTQLAVHATSGAVGIAGTNGEPLGLDLSQADLVGINDEEFVTPAVNRFDRVADSSGQLNLWFYNSTSSEVAPSFLVASGVTRGDILSTAANPWKFANVRPSVSYDYVSYMDHATKPWKVFLRSAATAPLNPTQISDTKTTYYIHDWQDYESGVPESLVPYRTLISYPTITANNNGNDGTPGKRVDGDWKITDEFGSLIEVQDLTDHERIVYDRFGRRVWFKDAAGYVHFTEYSDLADGGQIRSITDFDDEFEAPAGAPTLPDIFAEPPDTDFYEPGGKHLVVTRNLDLLGRETSRTDADVDITKTVIDDVHEGVTSSKIGLSDGIGRSGDDGHEFRIYSHWNTTTLKPADLIKIVRSDWSAGIIDTISASPQAINTSGTLGEENVASHLISLSRSYQNRSGQLTESREYYSLLGINYPIENMGSPGNDTDASGTHYHRTRYEYDRQGLQTKRITPTNTFYQTIFDAQDRPVTKWIGTVDSATGITLGSSKTTEYVYKAAINGTGSRSSEIIDYTGPTTSAADKRVTYLWYDWRGRKVAEKRDATQSPGTEPPDSNRTLTVWKYDNFDRVIATKVYDGDRLDVTTSGPGHAVVLDAASSNAPLSDADAVDSRRLKTIHSTIYDERGRVARTTQTILDPRSGYHDVIGQSYWYDRRGLLIKHLATNGVATKTRYDGAGRLTVVYKTDANKDSSSFSYDGSFASSWNAAHTVEGFEGDTGNADIVLEQKEFYYGADGTDDQVTRVILRERLHDAYDSIDTQFNGMVEVEDDKYVIYGGALDTPQRVYHDDGVNPFNPRVAARVTETRFFFDDADRLITSVDYGAVGETSLALSDIAPARKLNLVDRPVNPTVHSASVVSDSSLSAAASAATDLIGYEIRVVTSGNTYVRLVTGYSPSPGVLTLDHAMPVATNASTRYTLVSPKISTSEYDSGSGRLIATYDERGIKTAYQHDALGRVTKTTSAYANGVAETPGGTPVNQDDDNIYKVAYNGAGQSIRVTAESSAGNQVTTSTYVRPTSGLSSTEIYSNEILWSVTYPTISGVNAVESSKYNLQSQPTTFTDRNGTEHTYAYDGMGRPVEDRVTEFASSTDQSVRAIKTEYDALGRMTSVSSMRDTLAVMNEVERQYNSSGNLVAEFQSIDGPIAESETVTETQDRAATPFVFYDWDSIEVSGSTNRLAGMVYPSGRSLLYPTANNQETHQSKWWGVDARLSRVSAVAEPTRINEANNVSGPDIDNGPAVDPPVHAGELDRTAGNLYPNFYGYNGGSSTAFKGNRTHLEQYAYMGLGNVVRQYRPEIDLDRTLVETATQTLPTSRPQFFDVDDFTVSLSTSTAGDPYVGIDRHNRVLTNRWDNRGTKIDVDNDGDVIDDADDTLDVDAYQYGYDIAGNRLYRDNLRADTASTALDELYYSTGTSIQAGYDQLGRMTAFTRGDLNADRTAIAGTADRSQSFAFDELGNWNRLTDSALGSPQDRVHDAQNRITSVAGNTSLTYDANGNMTRDDQNRGYVYDAWNRLVSIDLNVTVAGAVDGDTVANNDRDVIYQYDGLGRRIVEDLDGERLVDHDNNGDTATRNVATALYYSSDWQLLEEVRATALSGSPNVYTSDRRSGSSWVTNPQSVYVWSAASPDQLILVDRDTDNSAPTGGYAKTESPYDYVDHGNPSWPDLNRGSGSYFVTGPANLDQRIYVQQDALNNVTSLIVDSNGPKNGSGDPALNFAVKERYAYDSYGKRSVLNPNFSLDTLSGADGTNEDGDTWDHDSNGSTAQVPLVDEAGEALSNSDFGFRYGFQGARHSLGGYTGSFVETPLVHMRNRDLHVDLGRFIRQDPMGHVDGPNTYQAFKSSPATFTDPMGLTSTYGSGDWTDWANETGGTGSTGADSSAASGGGNDYFDPGGGDDIDSIILAHSASLGAFRSQLFSEARRGVGAAGAASRAAFGGGGWDMDPPSWDDVYKGIRMVADWGGFIPGIGTAFDLVSLGLDLYEGDYASAALNLVGLIPLIGDAAEAAGRVGRAAAKGAGKTDEAAGGLAGAARKGPDCFVAGTPVLLGNGLHVAIETVRVGQRLATDGGVSNNGSKASNPNSTNVSAQTHRLVTMRIEQLRVDGTYNIWNIDTLARVDWIEEEDVDVGELHRPPTVDFAELGVPQDLKAEVLSIGEIPEIEQGDGRVVLTTIDREAGNIHRLSVKDAEGNVETLGVTGKHRFYNESRQWVETQELKIGEALRGNTGTLTITDIQWTPAVERVYNFSVEADHVYYVGDLSTLTHNAYQDHHVLPKYLNSGNDVSPQLARLEQKDHSDFHKYLDKVLHDSLPGAPKSKSNSTATWDKFFADNKGAREQANLIASVALRGFLSGRGIDIKTVLMKNPNFVT